MSMLISCSEHASLESCLSCLPWHCCCKIFTYTLTGKGHCDAVIQVIILVPIPPNYVQLCIIRRSNRAPPNEIFLCVQGCSQSALAQLSEKNTKKQNLKVQTVLQLRCGGLVSTTPLTNSLGASSKFVSLGVYFFFPSFSSFFEDLKNQVNSSLLALQQGDPQTCRREQELEVLTTAPVDCNHTQSHVSSSILELSIGPFPPLCTTIY